MKSRADIRPALLRFFATVCVATVGSAGVVHAEGYPVSSVAVGGRGVAKLPGSAAESEPEKQQGLITSAETFDLAPGETIVDHEPLPPGAESHAHHDHGAHHAGFAAPHAAAVPCDLGCNRTWYGLAEALYFQRDGDESFTLSNDFRLGEFDHELGGRLTIGRMLDCVDAIEFVYAGRLDWEMTAAAFDPADNLNLNLTPVFPMIAADLDTFFDAREQVQRYDATLDSFEVNYRSHGWDVVSTLYGVRVINYEEDYQFFSDNVATGQGLLREQVENLLVGGQVGADLLYPFGDGFYLGMRARLGLFVNFAEATTLVNNDGTIVLDNHVEDEELAVVGEYGIFATYHVGRSVRVRAGYDIWYLGGVGTVPEQFEGGTIGFGTGTEVFADEDVLVHGATAGVEFVY